MTGNVDRAGLPMELALPMHLIRLTQAQDVGDVAQSYFLANWSAFHHGLRDQSLMGCVLNLQC